ncbi:hypothetical protein Tco_0897183 [Tanacetum coccineum]
MRTTSAITNHTFQTYFGKSTPTHDPIREFSHYFGPNQPGAESDCDLEDMEEEVEYITDDEVVMSEQEEIKPWGVENMKDALISIIKSIRQEMKDDIMKRQFEASTASVSDEYLPSPVTKWTKRIKTLQILHDMLRLKDEIAGPNSLSPGKRGLVKRWHVCKPIHVTYDDGSGEDCSGICFIDYKDECEMEFMDINDFLQIRYGQHKIDDTIQERRIGHNNLHGSDREFIFNEWILDSYDVKEEYAREIGGRSFICITDREDEALPLERVHGARFKAMIRKELEGNKGKSLATIRSLIPDGSSVSSGVIKPPVVVSVTPMPVDGPTDSVSGLNLWTCPPSLGANADAAGTSKLNEPADSSDSFYASQDLDSETLHRIYVPKWNVTNDSVLDDPYVCRDLMDRLAPPALFLQLRAMDYDQLYSEFNVGAARQVCLGVEARMRAEHTLEKKDRLEDKCSEQVVLLSERDANFSSKIFVVFERG